MSDQGKAKAHDIEMKVVYVIVKQRTRKLTTRPMKTTERMVEQQKQVDKIHNNQGNQTKQATNNNIPDNNKRRNREEDTQNPGNCSKEITKMYEDD